MDDKSLFGGLSRWAGWPQQLEASPWADERFPAGKSSIWITSVLMCYYQGHNYPVFWPRASEPESSGRPQESVVAARRPGRHRSWGRFKWRHSHMGSWRSGLSLSYHKKGSIRTIFLIYHTMTESNSFDQISHDRIYYIQYTLIFYLNIERRFIYSQFT